MNEQEVSSKRTNKIRTIDSVFEVLIEESTVQIQDSTAMSCMYIYSRKCTEKNENSGADYRQKDDESELRSRVDILSLVPRRFRLLDQHNQIDASATTNVEFWLTEDVTLTRVIKCTCPRRVRSFQTEY